MSAAGVALLAIGLAAAKNDITRARGIDKIVALTHLCFAIPLAVFGAEHLSGPQSLLALVPSYMPWRMLWVYLVGLALTDFAPPGCAVCDLEGGPRSERGVVIDEPLEVVAAI